MSAQVRQALAEAASTVPGITGHPYFVQDMAPGTAIVRYERTAYPNSFGGVRHWNVVVVLPQEQADAEKFLDEKVPLVVAALQPHLVVTEAEAQRLDLPGVGVLPVVFINGHREE